MSIQNSDPWFGRGQTLGVTDASQGSAVTGSQKVFADTDPRTSRAGVFLSNRLVHCIAVRNTSGSALLPGAVVKFKKAAILDEVDGAAAAATDAPLGVVDEYLPATGVANNDVFWLVVAGPTAITTAGTPAAGDLLTATAGAAASGTAANSIGVALAAKVSGKVRVLLNPLFGHSGA
jgi:hypothetical protein